MENICYRQRSSVGFADTDASGWVHFSKILAYAERAEHDFLKTSGICVFDRGKGGWPRVKVSCEYKSPLTFEDEIEVCLVLDHIGGSSLVWKFEVFKGGDALAARGEMVTVKVNSTGNVAAISDQEREILKRVQ